MSDPGTFLDMKATESKIMQDYRFGCLTKLGVAALLMRGGFDSRYAIQKANSLAALATEEK